MNTTTRTITRGSLALLLTTLTGCTTHAVVRDATRTVGSNADQLGRGLSEYAKTLEDDSAARIERLAAQRRNLAVVESGLQAQLTVWSLAGRDGELRLYEGVVKAAEEAVAADTALLGLEAREAATLRETQAKFDTQAKELRSLVKQLSELAEPPDARQQGAFLLEYVKAVGDEVKELQDASKKAAAKSAAIPVE